jgi:Leucine zipper with capping helix domain
VCARVRVCVCVYICVCVCVTILLQRRNKIKKLTEQEDSLTLQIEQQTSRKRKALETRPPSDDRVTKLAKLSELKQGLDQVNTGLQRFKDNDPEVLVEIDKAKAVCRDSANRWTDNIFNFLSLFKKKRPDLKQRDIYKYFELPEDFDYIE